MTPLKPYSISLTWGDGEHEFALKIGQVRELEDKRGCGVSAIYGRVMSGSYFADDIYQVIRLGLIGGGMPPAEALTLCELYVLERPLAECTRHALAILMVRLFGNDGDDDPGKAPAAEAPETPVAA